MSNTTRILIVDDDPDLLQAYSEMLRGRGYEVWTASTGQEGLRTTRERRPDLVLLDVRLPDLSGTEVCQQIKADAALADVFVVLNSGLARGVEDKVDGLAAGADEYMVKPMAPEEFIARIRTVVRLRDATAALRASEHRHRRLIEILPDAVGLIDLRGRVLAVNPQGVAMLGYADPAELLAKDIFDLTLPGDHERIRRALANPAEGGVARDVKYTLLRKGGEPFPAEVSTSVSVDMEGRMEGFVVVAHDLTERRRAAEFIQLLADAVQSSKDLICITDPENRLIFANRAFLRAHGYAVAEIMGRKPDFLYSPRNPPGLCEQVFQETLRGGWEGEILNCRKDGTEFPIFLSTSQIRGSEGRSLGLIGVSRDISEQKRAERQIAAFAHLGQRLSGASTRAQAAQVILDIGSELFGLDAAYVDLYSPIEDKCISLLMVDTVDGERTVFPPSSSPFEPTPQIRRVMKEGAQLVNRTGESLELPNLVPFGDINRRAASMMFVPVRQSGTTIGTMSFQSYTPWAYSQEDLSLLQTLADHCGDALQRIATAHALRKAEAMYREIVQSATEGIFQTTPEGRVRSANPALARMLGYGSPEELMASVTDLGGQAYANPEKRQELQRLLETEGSVRGFEFEHYRKDGSVIWVSLNGRAVRDSSGAMLYYEGTLLDISERRRAENLVRVQRDFGVFLSSTGDLATAVQRLLSVALDNEGLDCGAVYLLNPGTGALDFIGHEGMSADFIKRASHVPSEPVRGGLGSADGGAGLPKGFGPMAWIVQQLKSDGLLALAPIPIQHGGQVVAVLNVGSRVFREIPAKTHQAIEALATQAGGAIARIRAEESLHAHRQLLQTTLDSLDAAVFVIDARTTTIQDCNAAASRIFGYPRGELIGHALSLLLMNEAMREDFERRLEGAVKERGFLGEFELKMRRKDGSLFPAEPHIVPIRAGAGQIVTWVAVVRDITERKRTEEELRALPGRIIEAQEAERQRVARELHDSVNQLIASAKMRLRKVTDQVELNPAAREWLARCDQPLVQALEENRRIAHNLRPTDLDELGLAEACRNLCKRFEARTRLKVKCRIARVAERCPPMVELNLFRILQEALNNAEQHAHAETVRVQLDCDPGAILLRIQDDGRGFDPNASKARKRKRPGIGLTNIRERAALLGGTCEIESKLKLGTTISVRVPVKAHQRSS